ncbi:hypothetical protein RND71_039023 [Anisodus tanguticus]|uniref:Uncharacterized protein n=1 Tax=Anisodus tanguticus TaxID=243964 RepID=A0AAE1UU20_9SOLA|nr:hypothetical protein RND71_039023 [Anisodus tanguticus]
MKISNSLCPLSLLTIRSDPPIIMILKFELTQTLHFSPAPSSHNNLNAKLISLIHACINSSVLLGDMGAGKSSLVIRFVKGQFIEFQELPTDSTLSLLDRDGNGAGGSCVKITRLMSLVKLYPGKQAAVQGKFETKHPRDPLQVWSYKKVEKILEFYHFLRRSILPRFPGTVIKA